MDIRTFEVLYKKIKGILILKENNIEWMEFGKQMPTISISLDSIKNLQATPITSPKAMIKIFKRDQKNEIISYIFTFISPKAQDDCNNFKLEIQKKNSKRKYSHNQQSVTDILTRDDFEQDIDLQQSLLKDNNELMKTFSEAVVKGNLTNEQFWSTRIHLLRTYAVEKAQKRGPYNVLTTIKPQTINNKVKLSLNKEKIHDIFQQHPLIKHIYSENVPPLSEDDFWGRFFLSRLCKKLRGEKINTYDSNDEILDKYLDYENDFIQTYSNDTKNISYFIDLTRNEHHITKTADFESSIIMKELENIHMMHSLNNLSTKMINCLKKNIDKKRKDNDNVNDLILNDLEGIINEDNIYLYIKDQKKNFLKNNIFQEDYSKKIKRPKLYMKLENMEHQIDPIININNISMLLRDTTHDIFQQINAKSRIRYNFKTVIPLDIKNQIIRCHETANEFLNQFWIKFLSNETIILQLPQIVSLLKKTNDNINTIIKSNDISTNSLEVIKNYFKPTIIAIIKALKEYKSIS
ncbi:hypothetical protein T552_04214 [Pneumocystis carinii B80]|uniref:BSD domain-containing protein n=1 Tax=Pneumocystis carinii (strain B80) TaxID=1408658 RepID=A0A0W4ZAT6_PNEC8|nr:hypothetical protein T552_04214 [Pneumocystis carinii B80]KTW25576.1 hypothetical protein T552_04214 [Pneumocystis carinii B80]